MAELPTGVVTFVFTDIEGSTRLLEHLGDEFRTVLGEHHRILRDAITAHGGVELGTAGDSFFAVFASVDDAVAAVLGVQRALGRHAWPPDAILRVRIGMHTGTGRPGGDNYLGMDVQHAARVSAAAHGGQVLATEATMKAAVLPAGASWRPMGSHQLRDLSGAIALYQLCHPDLVPDHPRLRSLEPVGNNLPAQPSSFLGRDRELAEGVRLIGGTRMLSITGAGGTGKTRLSYQLAVNCLDSFPDGVWVAELAPVSDPDMLPASLLAAVGLRDEPGRTATETLVAHLRSRQALVVLDNCEHLVSPAAALSADLLRGCNKLRVLATTREPLRVTGETVWALAPLALPANATVPLEELAATDAVALFCARAAEAQPGFTLDAGNAAAVTTICARLEGIPLAIELAAARMKGLPVQQIADLLEDRIDLLSGRGRRDRDRQASLWGAISWSHDLLDLAEQTLFRRLAVFTGGFTLEAAEAVCAGEGLDAEVSDVLEELVDKSLVIFGDERYSLLETIRQYANERLERAGEAPRLALLHARFYGALAHAYSEAPATTSGLERVAVEQPNLLAALNRLALTAQPIPHGQLLYDLFWFWDLCGHWRVAGREFQRYVDRGDRDPHLAGWCLLNLGKIHGRLVELDLSRSRFEEALGLARELGDRRLEAKTLGSLGHVALSIDDFQLAGHFYDSALEIARELGNRRLEGDCLAHLSGLHAEVGDYASARARCEEAMVIARGLGDGELEKTWGHRLSFIASKLGDYQEARSRYENDLEQARRQGARHGVGSALANLGNIAAAMQDYTGARLRFEEALVIARELGDPLLEGYCLGNLGGIAGDLEDYPAARGCFREALAVTRRLGTPQPELLQSCAQLLIQFDRHEQAAEILGAVAALHASSGEAPAASVLSGHEVIRTACREQLGEERLKAALERGGALDGDAACALAATLLADDQAGAGG